MATINQPKPSQPGSIQPEERPLQPGQTPTGTPRDATPSRTNPQTADDRDNRTEETRK